MDFNRYFGCSIVPIHARDISDDLCTVEYQTSSIECRVSNINSSQKSFKHNSHVFFFTSIRKPALQLYLKSGHKIGKPAPLFAKIEQVRLDELKKRYGGSQSDNQKQQSKTPTADQTPKTVEEAEKSVAAQGDKVRALKASGAEKLIVQEQVKILLALKKQLADLQLAGPTKAEPVANGESQSTQGGATRITEIEAEIVKQGEKVRTLKSSADKSVWQPEVDRLLALKKELVAAGGQPAPAPAPGKSKKKK